jgi:periplasmic divalent cation tolerance protein
MIILYLTCADKNEAETIRMALLEAKLIACARRSSVHSSYWWGGKINHDDEILLTMESVEEKFDDIEAVVTELHSYDEYVLTAVPVLRTTPGVLRWLKDSLE